MNYILANDIRNSLQADRFKITWKPFRHCNARYSDEVVITIGDTNYKVKALMSYTTIVAFEYEGVVYEIGKYSRTTSRQVTWFARDKKRVYYERRTEA